MHDTTTDTATAPDESEDRCDGLECPSCHEAAMGYWIAPGPRDGRCTCDACGHALTLYDYLLAQGMSDAEVVGFAISSASGVSAAVA